MSQLNNDGGNIVGGCGGGFVAGRIATETLLVVTAHLE